MSGYPEYPSIRNLYRSNGVNGPEHKRGPQYGFDAPGVDQIRYWTVTEKLDGMNIRVKLMDWAFEPPTVQYAGRTDRANLPGDLVSWLQAALPVEALLEVFPRNEETGLLPEVTLFGEGIGPGIQKAGQAYGGDKRFLLFDVLVGGWWLGWDDVADVARALRIDTAPLLARDVSLEVAKVFVRESALIPGSDHIEGIVARTDPYLFDRRGSRVMFKYKVRDL